jgi:hypothetical protein
VSCCFCCHAQALRDLLQDTSQIDRKARSDILAILAGPPIPTAAAAAGPTAAAAAGEGSVDSTDSLVKELCAADASLRQLVQPLQPSIRDRLRLLDLTRTLAGLEADSVRLFKFRVDCKVRVSLQDLCMLVTKL